MIKITKFSLGKGAMKNRYKGFSVSFLWFKLERIGYKNRFLWRLEISNWSD
jgi:hypothetical protein